MPNLLDHSLKRDLVSNHAPVVIGSLLGSVDAKIIDISNCFPLTLKTKDAEAEAKGKCVAVDGEKAKNRATFKYTKGNYCEAGEKIFLVARFNAQITEEKDGVYTITDAAASFETVKAWGEKAKQTVAAAAGATAAAGGDANAAGAPAADPPVAAAE